MKTTLITLIGIIATTASKALAVEDVEPYYPCPGGLYSVPQCCATDSLGIADLDCSYTTRVISNAKEFQKACEEDGQRARCCIVPVLNQAVLCETPVGL
ncbi:hydrophobin-like protein [Nemania sp. FL0916]|nr:hydrophobin-like protein [Nemania sp. FL0916]